VTTTKAMGYLISHTVNILNLPQPNPAGRPITQLAQPQPSPVPTSNNNNRFTSRGTRQLPAVSKHRTSQCQAS
jgi:hypothetical protein